MELNVRQQRYWFSYLVRSYRRKIVKKKKKVVYGDMSIKTPDLWLLVTYSVYNHRLHARYIRWREQWVRSLSPASGLRSYDIFMCVYHSKWLIYFKSCFCCVLLSAEVRIASDVLRINVKYRQYIKIHFLGKTRNWISHSSGRWPQCTTVGSW